MKLFQSLLLVSISLAMGAASILAVAQEETLPTPTELRLIVDVEIFNRKGADSSALACLVEGLGCLVVLFSDNLVSAIDVN